MANDTSACKATPTEKRLFRRLKYLLLPGGPPPGWNDPTPEELAEREVLATRRRRLDFVLAEYRRRCPKLAAREDVMCERLGKEIVAKERKDDAQCS